MKKFLKMSKLQCWSVPATIYKARCVENGCLVLYKKVRFEDTGIPYDVIREISFHNTINHPNILQLYEVIPSRNKIRIIFECAEETLDDALVKHHPVGGMPTELVKTYCFQILQAIHFCHAHGVLHRDLKPQNIFIDRRGGIKLGNFNLSRAVCRDRTFTHEVVTIWYRCPEILLGAKHYGAGIDIWSFGCILAELASDQPLFQGQGSEFEQLMLIFQALGSPTEDTWPGVSQLCDYNPTFPRWPPRDLAALAPRLGPAGVVLLRGAMAYDPAQRITARAALGSAYFDDVEER